MAYWQDFKSRGVNSAKGAYYFAERKDAKSLANLVYERGRTYALVVWQPTRVVHTIDADSLREAKRLAGQIMAGLPIQARLPL